MSAWFPDLSFAFPNQPTTTEEAPIAGAKEATQTSEEEEQRMKLKSSGAATKTDIGVDDHNAGPWIEMKGSGTIFYFNKDTKMVSFQRPDGFECKKKRVQKKRQIKSPSITIKHMKDSVVRAQAMAAVWKVDVVQRMTQYEDEEQTKANPESSTYLLNYDEIVERPDQEKMANTVERNPIGQCCFLQPATSMNLVWGSRNLVRRVKQWARKRSQKAQRGSSFRPR